MSRAAALGLRAAAGYWFGTEVLPGFAVDDLRFGPKFRVRAYVPRLRPECFFKCDLAMCRSKRRLHFSVELASCLCRHGAMLADCSWGIDI